MCLFESVNRDCVGLVTEVNLEMLWFLFDEVEWPFIRALEGGEPSIMPDENVVTMLKVGRHKQFEFSMASCGCR